MAHAPFHMQRTFSTSGASAFELGVRLVVPIAEKAVTGSSDVQVAVKPYLIYENGYEYTPPGTFKPPTASQVPDVIQGAVEMSIFNPGTTPITVRLSMHVGKDGNGTLALHAPCMGLPGVCTHGTQVVVSCQGGAWFVQCQHWLA